MKQGRIVLTKTGLAARLGMSGANILSIQVYDEFVHINVEDPRHGVVNDVQGVPIASVSHELLNDAFGQSRAINWHLESCSK